MPKGLRIKLGDIFEIHLSDGQNAYGRLFQENTLGIYKGCYQNFAELPENTPYFRFITVYRKCLTDGNWKIVGNRPFADENEAWSPAKCLVDAITKAGSLYYKGEIVKCTFDECKDLEVVAVWDRHHVEDMLMGISKWDDAIRKPTHGSI